MFMPPEKKMGRGIISADLFSLICGAVFVVGAALLVELILPRLTKPVTAIESVTACFALGAAVVGFITLGISKWAPLRYGKKCRDITEFAPSSRRRVRLLALSLLATSLALGVLFLIV
jgi:hypothetical protein